MLISPLTSLKTGLFWIRGNYKYRTCRSTSSLVERQLTNTATMESAESSDEADSLQVISVVFEKIVMGFPIFLGKVSSAIIVKK